MHGGGYGRRLAEGDAQGGGGGGGGGRFFGTHVDNGGSPAGALLPQEGHQVRPAQDVEVHGDLVQQQHLVAAAAAAAGRV